MHRNVPSQLIYPIRGMYLEAIDRARERVSITQPYFIPDRELVRALLGAVPAAASTCACSCPPPPTTSSPTGSRAASTRRC